MMVFKRMRRRCLLSIGLIGLCTLWSFPQSPRAQSLEQQLIVVRTVDWEGALGTAYRFVGRPGEWRRVGVPILVSLGYSGLGWGHGVVDTSTRVGPRKMEGDGRSPAGMFPLVSSFGRGNRQFKMPYEQIIDGRVCVDDTDSRFYNSFQVTRADRISPWRSAEDLFATDVYDLGIVVGHNRAPSKAGGGSCIFLHRWGDKSAPTPGCTAMSAQDLATLAEWLDPALRPMLVQLPRREYAALQLMWKLPTLPN